MQLVGPRFKRATPQNLSLALAVIGGARVGFSLLRDPLDLGRFESFTSYHYATQIPIGILRSPADLVITGLAAGLGVGLVIAARMLKSRGAEIGRGGGGYERIPYLLMGVVVGAVASGLVVLGDRVIRQVFADSAISVLTMSPFDLLPSHILLRVGVLALTVTVILLAAAFVSWGISLIRRYGLAGRTWKRPAVTAAIVFYLLLAVFIVAGADLRVLIVGSLAFACALVLDALRRKRLAVGLLALGLGFSLAASVAQFPYALDDYQTKRRESIQSAGRDIMARTDAWKISILEEALERVAEDARVGGALASDATQLDAFAFELWAGSILSRAKMPSGVYVLDAGHREIGRFSLQEAGQMLDIDAALREARYIGRPLAFTARGTSAGTEVELYVGIAPYFEGGSYVGSVVLSVPLVYGDVESVAGLRPTFFEAVSAAGLGSERPVGPYSVSTVSGGRIVATTVGDFEVGKRVAELDRVGLDGPAWLEHEVAGIARASYFVPAGDGLEGILLSYSLPTLSEKAVRFMGMTVGNIAVGFLVILVGALARGTRHLVRHLRGLPGARLRLTFASKLALAFVLIAIVPTLILGTASRRFLEARSREIMESKAEESLNLSRLALDRLVFGEAIRLARNPILMDALATEPSLLGQMVTHDVSLPDYDVSAAVVDSGGKTLAAFGDPELPAPVLESVLNEGRPRSFFSSDRDLTAKSAVPVRDEINPDRIVGCAFVSRRVDNSLTRQIASELGLDLTFYASSRVTASSTRELFISELMPSTMSPDTFLECFVSGRELHFSWERVGGIDVVVGYRPLRGHEGYVVGAMSVPMVFRKGEVGRQMEWTSAAISYLLVIVICAIFIFGLLLARRISEPMRQLIRGTLRIGSGDLSFTIPKPSDDEIGDLVTSFNRMTMALARSRRALSERKRYIETIIGNVGAGIISTDAAGRIDTFNTAAEGILGISARNARGRDARRLLRRVRASGLGDVLDGVQGDRGIARREVTFTRKDGQVVTLRAIATAVSGPRGRVMGKVIVFEDVTELIRSKKLVAWSEMARQVAHEIKNPLTPMKLSAQHLLQAHRDGAGDFDRVLEESVGIIVEQIESLRRIAVEFSQFSRMPERKLEWADVNAVLEESLSQYERTVGGAVDIVSELDKGLPRVKVDRDEIKRVFVNLIENAVQAMPGGGRLKIRSRKARARRPDRREAGSDYRLKVSSGTGGLKPSGFIEVSFSDSGTGIPPENADQLFEPNFSTKSGGTGLGLAICKGIVDAYGGIIVIESTEGVGTRVSVRLPLPDRPARRRQRGPRHSSPGGYLP
jgi:PAS domain S-box-containing protein